MMYELAYEASDGTIFRKRMCIHSMRAADGHHIAGLGGRQPGDDLAVLLCADGSEHPLPWLLAVGGGEEPMLGIRRYHRGANGFEIDGADWVGPITLRQMLASEAI